MEFDLSQIDDIDADPDYLYILRHLRQYGDSFTVDIVTGDPSSPVCVKYEQDEEEREENTERGTKSSRERSSHAENSIGSRILERKRMKKESSSNGVAAPVVSPVSAYLDEDYCDFLRFAQFLDERLVLERDTGVFVRYEHGIEGLDETSERETLTNEKGSKRGEKEKRGDVLKESRKGKTTKEKQNFSKIPAKLGNNNAFDWVADEVKIVEEETENEKEPDAIPAEILSRPESRFKERLINELKKPFDPREYNKLMDLVTVRKPKIKRMELRNMTKDCETEELGNSYFDYHPDIAVMVENAGSKKKGLTLLRGFIFWLQNVGHEESFMPWVSEKQKRRVIFRRED